MNKAIIHDIEIVSAIRGVNSEQTILGLLKEKGVPVLGTFWMSLAPGLKWKTWYDTINRSHVFTWME